MTDFQVTEENCEAARDGKHSVSQSIIAQVADACAIHEGVTFDVQDVRVSEELNAGSSPKEVEVNFGTGIFR